MRGEDSSKASQIHGRETDQRVFQREQRDSIDVPDNVVEAALEASGHAGPFLCLVAMERFIAMSTHDLHFKELRLSRAAYAETLAIELVHVFEEPHELFALVLARKFCFGDASPISSLEKAVHLRAMMFISDSFVSECIHQIWYGRLYLNEPEDTIPGYHAGSDKYGFEALGSHRMKMPVYNRTAGIIIFVMFLGIYSVVVNNRTDSADAVEVAMYVMALSFALNEVKEIFESGVLYLYDFYNYFDFSAVVFFVLSFATRVFAAKADTIEDRDTWNDWSFDLLSVNAIFLWARTLAIFSMYEYFGVAILVTRRMFKDAAIFGLLMAIMLVGFTQAFYGLRPDIPFGTSIYLLIKSILGGTDFDSAEGEADSFSTCPTAADFVTRVFPATRWRAHGLLDVRRRSHTA